MEEPRRPRIGAHHRPGRAQSTTTTLARRILDEVERRGLRPGDVLPAEAVMAKELEVGKGSLREALRILEVAGFISVKAGAGGGPIITDPGASAGFARMSALYLRHEHVRLADLLAARVAFEPFMARLAAEFQNEELLAELRQLRYAGRGVHVDDDLSYSEPTVRFHQLLA